MAKIEVNIIKSGDYWIDTYTNNKWDISNDLETVKKWAESLDDCIECVNCKRCISCVACIDCENCKSCVDCVKCKNCQRCMRCTDCEECSICDYCTNCKSCSDSTGCDSCENCRDCTTCYKLEGCWECVTCMNCKKCSWLKRCGSLTDVFDQEQIGIDDSDIVRDTLKSIQEGKFKEPFKKLPIDKNGVQIKGGDIVKVDYDDNDYYVGFLVNFNGLSRECLQIISMNEIPKSKKDFSRGLGVISLSDLFGNKLQYDNITVISTLDEM